MKNIKKFSFSSVNTSLTNPFYNHSHFDEYKSVNYSLDDTFSNRYEKFLSSNEIDDLDSNIFVNFPFVKKIQSGLIPPAIKYFTPGLIVFERPPTYQRIQYLPSTIDEISNEDEEKYAHNYLSFSIPIPWQLYIINYDQESYTCNQVRMYFMNSCLSSNEDKLYLPPLPNFYSNGVLCRPMFSTMDEIDRYSKDIAGVIASAYDWIWNSGFNYDLTEAIAQAHFQNSPSNFYSETSRVSGNMNAYFRANKNLIESFYTKWQEQSFDNILTLTWPNPSISFHFQDDHTWFYENNQEYIDDLYGTEYSEDEDAWLSNFPNPTEIVKTYKIIMQDVISSHSNIYRKVSVNHYSSRMNLVN